MRLVRGRVLDVGAGAGRVSLHLQERDHDVVAIDNSPGAVEVCRRRGVRDARLLDFADVDESLGVFDTIVMLGNNFGVFCSPAKAKRLLRRLRKLTSDGARILAESRDVSTRGTADAPWHVEYRRRNVDRARLPGQIRIRIRFRKLVGPWMDYPMVSPAELRDIVDGTGWQVTQTIDSDDTYVAVIEKTV
jgi:SAM-dependent methyltransferase